jgi:DNA-binding PadR family transcriptional regulator
MVKAEATVMVSGKVARNDDQKINYDDQNDKTWNSIATNYDWIRLAHLSNSFIILMALDEIKKPLTSGEISEFIALRSKGRLYKVSATIKDSLDNRLKREGLVEDHNTNKEQDEKKYLKVAHYTITPKGRKLLEAWISFLSAFQ